MSLKWSTLGGLLYRIGPPVTFLILARLLSPQSFGVLSTAMVFISFAQMFWEAGLGKALIQTEIAPEEAANVVFWINICLGFIIYGLFLIAGPFAAEFFKSSECGQVITVLGLQVPILALTSVQQNLFMRDLDFRVIFWARFFSSIAPAVIAIPMALLGLGVWSLVAGTLTGSSLYMLFLWIKSPWRPSWKFETKIAKRLIGFGIWVMAESFGAWLIIWGDSILLGRYLGMEDLGIYRVAWTVSFVVFGLLVTPIVQVAYPAFSRMQEDRGSLLDAFTKSTRLIACISIPTGMGLLLTGPELSNLAFGHKWAGLGFAIGIIGLLNGISSPLQINREVYNAIGRPDLNTKVLLSCLLVFIPTYLITAPYGLYVFLYSRLALSLLAIPIHLFTCSRVLGLSFFYWFRWTWNAIIASLTMGIIVTTTRCFLSLWITPLADSILLAFLFTVGLASYALIMTLLDKSLVLQMLRLSKRAIAGC